MAKVINSQALEPVNKALGLAGAGSGQTELMDGIVDQVLDVGQIARRGGTIAGTTGIFRVVLRTIHAGAGDIFASWFPYAPGVGVIPPFPDPVPDSLDVWLFGCSVERVSGTGTLDFATIRLTNVVQGFGRDSAGVAVASTSVMTLAFWNSIQASIIPPFGVTQLRQPWKTFNLRIPRMGATIASPGIAVSSQSDGIATFDFVMLVGLFPVALGQDAAV